MATVWLVHGIRERCWREPSLAQLNEILALPKGWRSQLLRYGYRLLPITNRRAVKAVIEAIVPGDYVVGYSNGAWAAVQAAEIGVPIDTLFLINPALHPSHAFPENIRQIHVFYCPTDFATTMGQWWRTITRPLPWRWRKPHGWGAMGRYGYQGKDKRVRNHMLLSEPGHSAPSDAQSIVQIATAIERATREANHAATRST